MLKWGSEKYSNYREWWSPDKPKPRLPEASGADYSRYIDKYPFENLVFKGGGAKGIAYIGACKILDEAGILRNIKRFAGTSAGAITATLLAIGMTPEEMLEQLSQKNLMELLDPPRGKLSYFNWLPHIPGVPSYVTVDNISMAMEAFTGRGLCAGDDFVTWFGSILDKALKKHHPDKKGLDQDITFGKLYDTLGVELCIVAYNMVFGNETYFHVKTTPVIKIREAVRMSMSIPVVFKPYEKLPGLTFIDGGLAANYPIWAFDGWYLSMRSADTFQRRLKSMKDDDKTGKAIRRMFYSEHRTDRFGGRNEKTLGILMLSAKDRELYQDEFMKRLDDINHEKKYENTDLCKAFNKAKDKQLKLAEESEKFFLHLVAERVRALIESIDGKKIKNPIETFPRIAESGNVVSDSDELPGSTQNQVQDQPKISRAEAEKRFYETFTEEDFEFLGLIPKDAFESLMIWIRDDDGNIDLGHLGSMQNFLQAQLQPKISRAEAEKRFNETFTEEDLAFLELFPKDKAFESLMLDDDGKLTTAKLKRIYENAGPLQLARRKYLGHRIVSESKQYYGTMLEFLGNNSGITEKDIGRSVGIDVEYVGTMDFDMEPRDMEFLMRQGAAATIAFLEEKKAALETEIEVK